MLFNLYSQNLADGPWARAVEKEQTGNPGPWRSRSPAHLFFATGVFLYLCSLYLFPFCSLTSAGPFGHWATARVVVGTALCLDLNQNSEKAGTLPLPATHTQGPGGAALEAQGTEEWPLVSSPPCLGGRLPSRASAGQGGGSTHRAS